MATTLEVFKDAKRGNYSTLPTVDVEILPDIHHCRDCGAEVVFIPDNVIAGWGTWKHKDIDVEDHGYVSPRTRCRYCHSEDDAVFVQHAWYDAVECSRCGGVEGYAIGD